MRHEVIMARAQKYYLFEIWERPIQYYRVLLVLFPPNSSSKLIEQMVRGG